MEEWKSVHIGDLGTIVTGKTPKTSIEDNYGGDTPFLSPSDDLSGKYVPITGRTLSNKGVSEVKNCLLPPQSVCVSCIGSDLGKSVITRCNTITNQQFNSIIPSNGFDTDFVYYAMQVVGPILNALSKTSTAVPIINKSTFSSFQIRVPDYSTQCRISRVLSALDDKIELNNRINHNLEEQADGIVSSLLNVGTTVLRLSDICKYVSQKIDCQSLTLDNYISTENMVPSRGGVTKSSNVPTGTAIEYSSGDILVSNIRPYFQKIWKATYSGGCSNDVLCFRSSTNSPSFLYHLLRQNSFFDHVMAGAKGSKMPRGDKAQIMNWTFVLSEDWEAMESKLSIIDKKVALLRVQNLMLIELRDSVLPRLMSGELKINDLTC